MPTQNRPGPPSPTVRVLSVTNKKLWVIAGVIGAASIGVVPALTAQAYPPGADLTIVAAPVPGTDGTYHVKITNIKPGCKYEVESRGAEQEGTFIGPGTGFETDLAVGTKPGTYVFQVHTKGCKPTENATYKIQVTHAQVSGPGSVKTGDKVTLRGTGFATDSRVQFTLSNGKGTTITSPPEVVESDGDVHYEFKAPAAGIWAVVATQGTASATFTLNVGNKVKSAPKPKPHHKPHHKPKPKPTHHKKPITKPKPKGH